MGTVWAGRAAGGDDGAEIVAVKTMLPSLSSDPRFERMFLAESRIASRIHHPNVCAILDQGEQDGILYYVMEWVDGDALVALLGGSATRPQTQALPCEVAVRIGIQAARGLSAAHELCDEQGQRVGVVHRDVSPHNILLTREGVVKIVDFGIAKALALGESPTTATGHMKGKIHFMSPEQIYGDTLDQRTDIFALGIVLYQLTTGVHPFAGGHDLAIMARIVRPEPVTPPSAFAPGYPPDLEAAVLRALEKRVEDRFASMAEFAASLEAVEARLGANQGEITAYIRGALAERAAKRAALIQQARRAVEAREGAPEPAAGEGGLTRTDPRRRRPTVATGVALVTAGAVLGATSLLWLRGSGGPEQGTQGRPAAEAAAGAGSAEVLEALPVPEEGPMGEAVDPFAPRAATSADAGAGDGGVAAATSGGATAPAGAASARGRAKFREPGF
jgi:serine/threonine-protein kinase